MLTEIRILSRGGQGGVTSAKLLAYAGHNDGKFVQAIPKYGAERKGAPIFADVRIADQHVQTHAPVIMENAHSFIVFEPSLVNSIPFDVLSPGTIVIVNSKEIPAVLRDKTHIKIGKIDAVDIARTCGLVKSGTVLVSTPMLGAWAKATGLVTLDALFKATKKQFGEGKITDSNIQAIQQAYDQFEYIN